jgi:multisubunit Na+/H+ antiporter MnhB subunit
MNRSKKPRRFNPDRDVKEWKGAYVPYDILKEAFVAFLAVAVLIVLLAVVFSSPDEPAITLKSWSVVDPVDFAQTAITELDGTSGTASYGPPYNSTPAASQHIGFFQPEQWFGVHQPIDTAQDFVIGPLRTLPNQPLTMAAITLYTNSSAAQRTAWTTAYEKAVANATDMNGRLHVPSGRYGPVGLMIGSLTDMAQTGGLDGTLLSEGQFYNTNYTKPLLFLADGTYLADKAQAQHLSGSQWGMMNETGNYPGQAWLWLYTMWYQVSPMNSSTNGDLEVWVIMMVLSVGLIFLPFIPILRSVPRWTKIYKLIWRRHYRELAGT